MRANAHQSVRALTLPVPARSLYNQTQDLLDRWLPDALPEGGVWTIGCRLDWLARRTWNTDTSYTPTSPRQCAWTT